MTSLNVRVQLIEINEFQNYKLKDECSVPKEYPSSVNVYIILIYFMYQVYRIHICYFSNE